MAGSPGYSGAASAASSLSAAQTLSLASAVNFGAGYISNPNNQTVTPTATATATASDGGAANSNVPGGNAPSGGFAISKQTGEIIAAVVGGLILLGVGAYLFEKKILH